MRLWKVLSADRRSLVSGTGFQYPADGVWTGHTRKKIALCAWGFHFCEGEQVLSWLREGLLAEVEPCGRHDPLRGDDKCVSCQLRVVRTFPLTARVLRLFAADCAERALLASRARGREPDPRSWEAVRVVRLYADGEATKDEVKAAAAAAADAAYAAAAAAYAAAYAAYAAADAAAYAYAAYAARRAERPEQYRQLLTLVGAGEP